MVWLRGSVLVIVLAGAACSGSPTESQTGSDDDDDDDDDDSDGDGDGDGDDDATGASDAGTSATDPSDDTSSDPSNDATDPDTGDPTSDDGSDPTTDGESSSTGDTGEPACHPLLNEIAFDVVGEDDQLEWIAITSECDDDIDLSDYSLGWGGENYAYGTQQLDGTLSGHGCFVVGGPMTVRLNYTPAFAQSVNLEMDLQNADGADGDGVGLFLGPAGEITPESVPVDSVLYGEMNPNELVDANGEVATPDVSGSNDMQTIARTDAGWVVNGTPSPNDCTTPM